MRDVGREVERVARRRLRPLVGLDEVEVAVRLRVVGRVGGIRAGDLLDQVGHAVAVGVVLSRVGLAGVHHAVAVLVLGRVEDAVAVGVPVHVVGQPVVVGVHRRRVEIRVAGLDRVGDAVVVRVEVAEVRHAVVVGVHLPLVTVRDPVVVRVEVEVVGCAVAVSVHRPARGVAPLVHVRDPVAVGVVGRQLGVGGPLPGVDGAWRAVGSGDRRGPAACTGGETEGKDGRKESAEHGSI